MIVTDYELRIYGSAEEKREFDIEQVALRTFYQYHNIHNNLPFGNNSYLFPRINILENRDIINYITVPDKTYILPIITTDLTTAEIQDDSYIILPIIEYDLGQVAGNISSEDTVLSISKVNLGFPVIPDDDIHPDCVTINLGIGGTYNGEILDSRKLIQFVTYELGEQEESFNPIDDTLLIEFETVSLGTSETTNNFNSVDDTLLIEFETVVLDKQVSDDDTLNMNFIEFNLGLISNEYSILNITYTDLGSTSNEYSVLDFTILNLGEESTTSDESTNLEFTTLNIGEYFNPVDDTLSIEFETVSLGTSETTNSFNPVDDTLLIEFETVSLGTSETTNSFNPVDDTLLIEFETVSLGTSETTNSFNPVGDTLLIEFETVSLG